MPKIIGKPEPTLVQVALDRIGVPRERAAMVGDQLFADILAGRLAGLFTILVRPTSPEEPWFTRLKRPLERSVLRWICKGAAALRTVGETS